MTKKGLGVGDTGEFVVKGPQVMVGYLDNEKATTEMVQDDWLFTG